VCHQVADESRRRGSHQGDGEEKREAAIVVMIALNSMTAMVVANNVRTIRRLK